MKYFLIAGEPSGDMHAAKLMSEIKKIDRQAEFGFLGGDLMTAQGGILYKHLEKMAFMGLLPVLLNLRKIKKNFNACQKHLLKFAPHVLILVDYPGFNLRMAKFAHMNHIQTAYYISPKIWAWKTNRVKQIKAYVDHMYTIFPFETEFYKNYNYDVSYVGNPVWELIQNELRSSTTKVSFIQANQLANKPIIALLAGSRKHEIELLLPEMEKMRPFYPNHQMVIAGAPGISPEFYKKRMRADIKVVYNQTYKLLRNSVAAIVASGTATLETALLDVPQLVVYKMGMGRLLAFLRKFFFKIDYFSLVNLVAEREVVKELFQQEINTARMKTELDKILNDDIHRSKQLKGYAEIRAKLSSTGAAKTTAFKIIQSIKKE
ncbi:MAG: lipid-A-disaccharide synthase [Prolixibacteraceae bacterium]